MRFENSVMVALVLAGIQVGCGGGSQTTLGTGNGLGGDGGTAGDSATGGNGTGGNGTGGNGTGGNGTGGNGTGGNGTGGTGTGGTGTGGAGGQETGGTGGDGTGGSAPDYPSCQGLTVLCQGESCCTSIEVPGGTFPMGRSGSGTDACPTGVTCDDNELPEHAATVATFVLDKYEVTVGRFRRFVEQYVDPATSAPPSGSGAHPLIAGSGWDSAWNTMLPASQPVFKDTSHLKCSGHATWTDTAASLEASPINCVNWYEAFAFCIWDGGRLPTEAEWEYAAAGGAENRLYPWGSNGTEPLPANYNANHGVAALPVGSEPSGNGRWGHADLAGSMSEWNLDYWGWYAADGASCDNCANLIASSSRAVRGGHWDSWWPRLLRAANRGSISAASPSASAGLRCARAIVGP